MADSNEDNQNPTRNPDDPPPPNGPPFRLNFPPCPSPSVSDSLPPDVATSRHTRINNDILSYFKRPANPDSATTPCFKGIGVYTHVQVATLHRQNAHPQRKIVFLPLGGPGRVERKGALRGEVPEEIRKVYEEVKGALRKEEEAWNKRPDREFYERAGGSASSKGKEASSMVPPPPPPGWPLESIRGRDEDVDMGGMEDANTQGRGRSVVRAEERPRSYGSASAGRRLSTEAPAASVAKGGSKYDSSRDPRRRREK